MTPPTEPAHASPTEPRDAVSTEAEVVAFARDRSVPCPRCAYDLRNIEQARCPECGEPLVLRIGTPRPRFGWLILAMAPGCFSGVAAVPFAIPTYWALMRPHGSGPPLSFVFAEAFGVLSAGAVVYMYRSRQQFMALPFKRQSQIAVGVWLIHFLALGIFALATWYLNN